MTEAEARQFLMNECCDWANPYWADEGDDEFPSGKIALAQERVAWALAYLQKLTGEVYRG